MLLVLGNFLLAGRVKEQTAYINVAAVFHGQTDKSILRPNSGRWLRDVPRAEIAEDNIPLLEEQNFNFSRIYYTVCRVLRIIQSSDFVIVGYSGGFKGGGGPY